MTTLNHASTRPRESHEEWTVENAVRWARRSGFSEAQIPEFQGFLTLVESTFIHKRDLVGNRPIDKGAFGSIEACTLHGSPVAVKRVSAGGDGKPLPQLMREALLELRVLQVLRHPHIVSFIGCAADFPDGGTPFIGLVFEMCSKGSLAKLLHEKSMRLIFQDKVRLGREIAMGMSYVHSLNIVHRDLNTRNILLTDDMRVRIADFGCARKMSGETYESSTISGSPAYMPPEQLKGSALTLKVDVWAFGTIMWELASEKLPWSHIQGDWTQIKERVCVHGEGLPLLPDSAVPDDPKGAREKYNGLIHRAYSKNPANRPSFQECLRILNDINASGVKARASPRTITPSAQAPSMERWPSDPSTPKTPQGLLSPRFSSHQGATSRRSATSVPTQRPPPPPSLLSSEPHTPSRTVVSRPLETSSPKASLAFSLVSSSHAAVRDPTQPGATRENPIRLNSNQSSFTSVTASATSSSASLPSSSSAARVPPAASAEIKPATTSQSSTAAPQLKAVSPPPQAAPPASQYSPIVVDLPFRKSPPPAVNGVIKASTSDIRNGASSSSVTSSYNGASTSSVTSSYNGASTSSVTSSYGGGATLGNIPLRVIKEVVREKLDGAVEIERVVMPAPEHILSVSMSPDLEPAIPGLQASYTDRSRGTAGQALHEVTSEREAQQREVLLGRLLVFYTKHNPTNLSEAKRMLQQHGPSEVHINSLLRAKYNADLDSDAPYARNGAPDGGRGCESCPHTSQTGLSGWHQVRLPDGGHWIGEMMHGNQHGAGRLVLGDGQSFEGRWEKGALVQASSLDLPEGGMARGVVSERSIRVGGAERSLTERAAFADQRSRFISNDQRTLERDGLMKEKLIEYYAVHNPRNLQHVDAIVSEYGDREGELNAVMRAKYGVDLYGNQNGGQIVTLSQQEVKPLPYRVEERSHITHHNSFHEANLGSRGLSDSINGMYLDGVRDPSATRIIHSYPQPLIGETFERVLPSESGQTFLNRERIILGGDPYAARSSSRGEISRGPYIEKLNGGHRENLFLV